MLHYQIFQYILGLTLQIQIHHFQEKHLQRVDDQKPYSTSFDSIGVIWHDQLAMHWHGVFMLGGSKQKTVDSGNVLCQFDRRFSKAINPTKKTGGETRQP